ncbi:Prefoldin subunit 4 [Dacryopinax primogenitus]|uniref:Prefoldin subunit 4 n=1 Tax=Dacryopinax primogenitus (strain DJM 731) TaxID=1858805 RepID=M5G615_DACPD|nr:Prefoldin subunit 4 [Dacryopinax primogenitus]EJU04159.1 Prefoldin subunit 4 [Dacryopinax primogenitus]
MRLLNQEDEVDESTEVTWEDQQRINTFSKLNQRFQDAEELLKKKRTEKEYLDDVAMELELVDEDEPVLYKIGETFVHIKLQHAQQLLEKEHKTIDAEVAKLQSQVDESENGMKELKVVLYAKFGNAINLETNPA